MNQDKGETSATESQSNQARSQSSSSSSLQEGKEPIPTARPSQAEGDHETIEADIAGKEAEGKL